jgi:hypothetical protein
MGLMVNPNPRPIYPVKRPGTLYVGGWVGSRTSLDGCVKSRPPLGLAPRTVQPLAICYTDYRLPYTNVYKM